MPQLDFTTYSSGLKWILLTVSAAYLLFRFVLAAPTWTMTRLQTNDRVNLWNGVPVNPAAYSKVWGVHRGLGHDRTGIFHNLAFTCFSIQPAVGVVLANQLRAVLDVSIIIGWLVFGLLRINLAFTIERRLRSTVGSVACAQTNFGSQAITSNAYSVFVRITMLLLIGSLLVCQALLPVFLAISSAILLSKRLTVQGLWRQWLLGMKKDWYFGLQDHAPQARFEPAYVTRWRHHLFFFNHYTNDAFIRSTLLALLLIFFVPLYEIVIRWGLSTCVGWSPELFDLTELPSIWEGIENYQVADHMLTRATARSSRHVHDGLRSLSSDLTKLSPAQIKAFEALSFSRTRFKTLSEKGPLEFLSTVSKPEFQLGLHTATKSPGFTTWFASKFKSTVVAEWPKYRETGMYYVLLNGFEHHSTVDKSITETPHRIILVQDVQCPIIVEHPAGYGSTRYNQLESSKVDAVAYNNFGEPVAVRQFATRYPINATGASVDGSIVLQNITPDSVQQAIESDKPRLSHLTGKVVEARSRGIQTQVLTLAQPFEERLIAILNKSADAHQAAFGDTSVKPLVARSLRTQLSDQNLLDVAAILNRRSAAQTAQIGADVADKVLAEVALKLPMSKSPSDKS